MSEKHVSSTLVEAARRALEEGWVDPFTVAVEAGVRSYYSLLDLDLVEKLPDVIEKEREFDHSIASIIGEVLACSRDYVEKAKEFYERLVMAEILFSPTARCVYVEKIVGGRVEVRCIDARKALYEQLLGLSKPVTVEPARVEKSGEDTGSLHD